MFDTLSDKLQGALGDLRSRGVLTEEDLSRAMREIRLALLEADVNFKVVKDFVARVRERASGRSRQQEPLAGPGSRPDRPRGADRADGLGRVEARLFGPPADRHPPRRPPGVGEDHGRGQAGAAPAQAGGQVARARSRGPPASGRDRPAGAARQADSDPGLPRPLHDGRRRGRPERAGPGAGARPRRSPRRHRRAPADRRAADGGARRRPRRGEAAQRPARPRRHDRPGGRRRRGSLPGRASTSTASS